MATTMIASNAMAATETVTANIEFAAPLILTKNSDIDFGTVSAGVADTYTINTSGTVTAAGSGQTLGGVPTAGDITVSGSSTQVVDISVGNYTANNGVTPQNATCSYNGGSEVSCNSLTGVAAPGSGTTLLLGVQAVVNGTQASGTTAAPTFDVTVVYQ